MRAQRRVPVAHAIEIRVALRRIEKQRLIEHRAQETMPLGVRTHAVRDFAPGDILLNTDCWTQQLAARYGTGERVGRASTIRGSPG